MEKKNIDTYEWIGRLFIVTRLDDTRSDPSSPTRSDSTLMRNDTHNHLTTSTHMHTHKSYNRKEQRRA